LSSEVIMGILPYWHHVHDTSYSFYPQSKLAKLIF